MNGVLSKPLRKESLENLLNEHFSNIDNGGDNAMYDLEIFNKNKFELLYDNDDFRKEIINTFFDEKQNNLQNISNALKSNDCALIHKAFHYMKGSFSYLNAPKILELTQQILNLSTENRIHDVLLLEEPFLDNYHLLIRELSIYMSNKTF